jgi:LPXTG-motif cell wall-anchored protein
MAAIWKEAVMEPPQRRGAVKCWGPTRYSGILAVHTTLANPFVIAGLVLVIAAVLLLRRRRRG